MVPSQLPHRPPPPLSVVLCKVFIALKTKSYDEKFVIAQCAFINDGAILKYFELIK